MNNERTCQNCIHWEKFPLDVSHQLNGYGSCHRLTDQNEDDEVKGMVRVYDDSTPITTHGTFGCNLHTP